MDSATINGIKLAFEINADTGTFTDQLAQLTDAVKELDSGVQVNCWTASTSWRTGCGNIYRRSESL